MRDYTWKIKQGFIAVTLALLTLGSSNLAWAKSADQKNTENNIKSGIDATADSLKKGVDKAGDKIADAKESLKKGAKKFGEKVEDLQTYFRKKFHEQATFGPATVSDVTFNGHHLATVVKPGERIEGQLKCILDKDQHKDIKYHSLLIGFKGRENAETAVDIGRGIFIDKESKANFTLIAPSEPGFYKVRFRPINGYIEHDVLKRWKDEKGEEPNNTATIGLIYVKA
jgi:hypothetical protein